MRDAKLQGKLGAAAVGLMRQPGDGGNGRTDQGRDSTKFTAMGNNPGFYKD